MDPMMRRPGFSLSRRSFLSAGAAVGAAAVLPLGGQRVWAQQVDGGGGHLIHEDDRVAVWWVAAAQKVDLVQPLENSGAETLKVAAAGRERESFQVVVRPKVAVRSFKVGTSALRGPSTISSNHIKYARVGYVRVDWPSGPLSLGTGPYADRLEPLPVWNLEPGRNYPVWVTIDVPAGTPAGKYTGVVTLSGEGLNRVPIDVRLNVHPFSLPSEPSVATMGRLWRGRIDEFDPAAREADYRGYYKNLREHRLNGANILEPVRVIDKPGEPPELDSSGFDRMASLVLDDLKYSFTGFPGLRIRSHRGTFRFPPGVRWNGIRIFRRDDNAELTEEFESKFKTHAALIAGHLRARGWLAKCYVNMVDELATHDPLTVRKLAAMFGKLKEADPGIRILNTSMPVEDLFPYVDLWVVHADLWRYEGSRKLIDAATEAGETVWVYHNSLPLIDYPAIRSRVLPWLMWKEGITGSLSWWALTAWYEGVSDVARQRWAGNGALVYPPRSPLEDGTPVNSIRWELFSKGLEDYEYLKRLSDDVAAGRDQLGRDPSAALRRAVEKGDSAIAAAEALIHDIPRVSGPRDAPYESDPAVYDDVKRQVANAITAIEKQL